MFFPRGYSCLDISKENCPSATMPYIAVSDCLRVELFGGKKKNEGGDGDLVLESVCLDFFFNFFS